MRDAGWSFSLSVTIMVTIAKEKAGHTTDFFFGTPGKIRTYDLLYRKQTLYPAELRVRELIDSTT